MKLQQLKYAIEVARWGSINIAAKKLFISQPSLSAAIKELETEIHQTIFERTNRGVSLTREGSEFLGYARQVVEQVELLERQYLYTKPSKSHFAISTQHYAFAVNAFVDLISAFNLEEYEFNLRETRTYEIIDDVKNLRSEIGILYVSDFNRKVIGKFLKENNLKFHQLFVAKPHVFISKNHPLANLKQVTLQELDEYPCLCFEQGEYNSFYFSEEILSTISHAKTIRVSDRATLFNLLIGLNGYIISTGVISEDLNGNSIIAVPLEVDELIEVGWIAHMNMGLSQIAKLYIEKLEQAVKNENVI